MAGDAVASGMIGRHQGHWHRKVVAAVSIPGGAYRPGELSSLAPNRRVGDFTAAATYSDPELGLDLSATVGYTVNGVNRARSADSRFRSAPGAAASRAEAASRQRQILKHRRRPCDSFLAHGGTGAFSRGAAPVHVKNRRVASAKMRLDKRKKPLPLEAERL